MSMITSKENKKIKDVIRLKKSSTRKKEQKFLIDGDKEIGLALAGGVEIETIFFNSFYCEDRYVEKFAKNLVIEVSEEIFRKISIKESPSGLLGVGKFKKHSLDLLQNKDDMLVVVIESLEKPGNIGAILRTCDAAGVDSVLVVDAKTDIYNPNIIRSSLGTVFTNQIAVCTKEEAINWLLVNRITTFAATPSAEKVYTDYNYKGPTAFLVGTEHDGLSLNFLNIATNKIKIQMRGKIDSLNASVSAAILIFEAQRQRK